jgi:hypothetical protein
MCEDERSNLLIERAENLQLCVSVLVTTHQLTYPSWLAEIEEAAVLCMDLGVVVQVYAREKAKIQAALGFEE